MKKFAIILLVFNMCYQADLISQPCLPDGITFSNQEEIDNFQANYPNCDEIEGDVIIEGDDITNLDGLIVVTSIGGRLSIDDNDILGSITGLGNINSLGERLYIGGNVILTSLEGLNALTYVGEDLWIQLNFELASLSGLENLTAIGGNLHMEYNYSLTNLAGLESLSTIGGAVHILNHESLINLVGLEGLTTIGNGLYISYGNSSMTTLTGLENVSDVGGAINIGFLYGGGIGNPALTSLSGLENIDAGTIDELNIFFNNSLSTCEVQSICDYLASPNAEVTIHNNAPGCNNPEEVEEACETISINENYYLDNLSINPNPFMSYTEIEFSIFEAGYGKLSVIDFNGKEIQTLISKQLRTGVHQLEWKAKGLPAGIYFLRLETNEVSETRKLIILD